MGDVREPPRGAAGAVPRQYKVRGRIVPRALYCLGSARVGGGCSDKRSDNGKGAYSPSGNARSERSSLHGFMRASIRPYVAMQSAQRAGGARERVGVEDTLPRPSFSCDKH